MIITIIGGASGVGKTSLLNKASPNAQIINTGTVLKECMALKQRDDVKKGDWSAYEENMTEKLKDFIAQSAQYGKNAIIDTHFAAKIYGKTYRIGLREKFIFFLGEACCHHLNNSTLIQIVLITADPYALIERRRLDTSRTRDLIPSDCYNDLRANNVYSFNYYSEVLRAIQKCGKFDQVKTQYTSIDNRDFDCSAKYLCDILNEEKYNE